MADQYATIAHRWFDEVWNQQRESTIDALLADEAVVHGIIGPDGQVVVGPTGFKPFFHQFCQAFPDIHVAVEDTVVEGDRVAARCQVTGTHSGPGLMAAPTGRNVSFTGMCMLRMQDGKIAEAWNNFDFLSMYHQLGLQLR